MTDNPHYTKYIETLKALYDAEQALKTAQEAHNAARAEFNRSLLVIPEAATPPKPKKLKE